MLLSVYQRFIERAQEKLKQDERFLGLLAGGSIVTGTMDEYSDLDLIIIYDSAYREQFMNQRLHIAEGLGNLLSAFTGEHVGEPRLVICLYGPQPFHVDLKFITIAELKVRIENPLILWSRDSEINQVLENTSPSYPSTGPQWMEDRFWVWIHYSATKLGRGELFEVIDTITFIRSAVIGPLILKQNGHQPRGVRKLEQLCPDETEELKESIPHYSIESCYHALKATIRIYRRLRQPSAHLIANGEAEQASVDYLETVYASLVKKRKE